MEFKAPHMNFSSVSLGIEFVIYTLQTRQRNHLRGTADPLNCLVEGLSLSKTQVMKVIY